MTKENKKLRVVEAEYDPELGSDVAVELSGERTVFTVQLIGGEYQSQMGCWIIKEGVSDDFDFIDTEFEDYSEDIINAGEKAYDEYIKAELNAGVEENEKFEFYIMLGGGNVSATASYCIHLEKSNIGRYRIVQENSGHIGPTDYESFPDFVAPVYFDDEESAREYYKSNKEID